MEKNTLLKKLLSALLAVLAIWLILKYVVSLFLPFIIAIIIAFILKHPINLLSSRLKISKKILSAVFLAVILAFFSFVTFLSVNRLLIEIQGLLVSVSENSDEYVNRIFSYIDSLAEKLPFIEAIGGDLSETVSEVIKNTVTELTSRLPGLVTDIISMLPHILIFTVVIILSIYYFSADFDEIAVKMTSLLPEKVRKGLSRFKARLADTGIAYLKACLVMLVITYFEVLTGFLMLGVKYPFIFSLIVALVDMLPIFGVGTVLVPYAVWCKINGDTYTAVGMIIIFAVVTVVRRFIEPKIIGQRIGLSPIATLVAMYVGYRLFGLTGLFFSPLVAILILHALPPEISGKLGLSDGDGNDILK